MRVQIAFMSAELKISELGSGGADDAVRIFLGFPWGEALNQMKQLELSNANDIVFPDITFTALPAHLVVQAQDTHRFNVEVCVPRVKKLFGLFTRAKFYAFEGVSRDQVPQMLRQFCADDLEQKHDYFTRLRRTSAG